MLDEALLRPGRLEVQVEIGLPDDKGRLQILKVRGKSVSCIMLIAVHGRVITAPETLHFRGCPIWVKTPMPGAGG